MNKKLSESEYLQHLEQQTLIGQDFIEAAFQDWLEDHEDYRCPFPEQMQAELRERTFRSFMEWTFHLDNPDQLRAEDLSEKFGEIIQAEGFALAQTNEERLTIQYPDLPRLGDQINFHDAQSQIRAGEIIQRSIQEKAGNKELRVVVRYFETGEEWETSFDLVEE